MQNPSKTSSCLQWRKWYSSGAVSQKVYPAGSLLIDAIGTAYKNNKPTVSTLSLGQVIINSEPDWSVSEPLCAVVVMASEKFKCGNVLDRLPGNSVPCEVYYGK